MLPDDQLTAVLAHEVTHLRHQDTLLAGWWTALVGLTGWTAATLFAVGMAMALAGSRSRHRRHQEGAMIGIGLAVFAVVMGSLVVILLQIARRAGMRQRGVLADEHAVVLTGRALPLALALERMTAQPALLSGPSAIGLLFSAPPSAESGWRALPSTHPSTAYRIQRLYALAKHTGELPAP